MKTRQLVLKSSPENQPVLELGSDNSTFEIKDVDLPELADGQLLLETIYLSNDPAQRGWIQARAKPERFYRPPVQIGQVMAISQGVYRVLESKSTKFQKGDLVVASAGWAEHAILNEAAVKPVPGGLRPTVALGTLGMTGLTAWVGVEEILKLKKGESIVVSGAAGAVGSTVVAYAKKVIGASKVVAICGSKEKCDWVAKLGADVTLNYKDADFLEKLDAACQGNMDTYFDNVGGETLNRMFSNLKTFGRIAVCGSISNYNSPNAAVNLSNWFEVIVNRLRVEGFLVMDHVSQFGKALQDLGTAYKEGKLPDGAETVIRSSFEDVPKTWGQLFVGGNTGKLITQLKDV